MAWVWVFEDNFLQGLFISYERRLGLLTLANGHLSVNELFTVCEKRLNLPAPSCAFNYHDLLTQPSNAISRVAFESSEISPLHKSIPIAFISSSSIFHCFWLFFGMRIYSRRVLS